MTALENTTLKKRTEKKPDLFRNIPVVRGAGGGLRPVTQVVRPVIKKILPQKSIVFQQLFDFWPMITSGMDAVETIPEKLTFPRGQQNWGILSLWTRTSAQAMELSYNKAQLIQRINSAFGYAMIADLRITAHPGKSLAPLTVVKRPLHNTGIKGNVLDDILTGISNPALRTILGELGGMLQEDPGQRQEQNRLTGTQQGENNA